jgi:predicted RNA-binding Zn-ribbon protein involved in translation (DUF1610 family)
MRAGENNVKCQHCGEEVDHLVVEVKEWNKYTVNIDEGGHGGWSAAEPMDGSEEGAVFNCPKCGKPSHMWNKNAPYSLTEMARKVLKGDVSD